MKIGFVFLAVLFSFSASAHKFYISIADMEYDSTHQSINVSIKMTGHDFEDVLKRKFRREIELETLQDSSEVGRYMQQYLAQNFQLYSAGQKLEMSYVGREIDTKDELFFYLSYKNVKDPTSIKILNKLLFSVSDQQQNIVHYKYRDRTKSVTLIPSKSEERITFTENDED